MVAAWYSSEKKPVCVVPRADHYSIPASLPSLRVAWAGTVTPPEPLFPLNSLKAQTPILSNGLPGSNMLLFS